MSQTLVGGSDVVMHRQDFKSTSLSVELYHAGLPVFLSLPYFSTTTTSSETEEQIYFMPKLLDNVVSGVVCVCGLVAIPLRYRFFLLTVSEV